MDICELSWTNKLHLETGRRGLLNYVQVLLIHDLVQLSIDVQTKT